MLHLQSSITTTLHNEAVAHNGTIQCVAISPSSGQVVATGGEDETINLWRINEPKRLLVSSSFRDPNNLVVPHIWTTFVQTFQKFRSPVSALSFSRDESLLAAGSESGSVKVINLTAQKGMCILLYNIPTTCVPT